MRGRRLHTDQGGALAPLFLFVLLFFLWGAIGILNAGQDASDRIKAQNAIDAVSLMASEQAARDLNVMAMNQVASAQSFTIAISSLALRDALTATGLRALSAAKDAIDSNRCWPMNTRYGAIICIGIAIQMLSYGIEAYSLMDRYEPGRGVEIGNRLTAALGRMSRHIVATHPERVSAIARELGDANGLEAIFVYPVCDSGNGSNCHSGDFPGPSLPVDPAPTSLTFDGIGATYEMCLGIVEGGSGFARLDFSRHGFPNDKGPLTAGGSGASPLREHINRTSGVSGLVSSLDRAMQRAWLFVTFDRRTSQYSSHQSSNSNQFLDAFDAAWAVGCPTPEHLAAAVRARSRSNVLVPAVMARALSITRPVNYWLKGRPALGSLSPVGTVSLNDYDYFHHLFLGAQTKGERSNDFAFDFDNDPFYAYAQSFLFNEAAHDLYTGRWNADLVPARYMDQPAAIGAALGSQPVSASFAKLRRILSASSNSGEWQDVNTH